MTARAVSVAALIAMLPAFAAAQTVPVFKEVDCIRSYFRPLDLCRAAMRGDATAAHRLGRMFAYGDKDKPRDNGLAVQFFRLAAEGGSAVAAADLGRMYAQGRGVERDPAEAERWYRKSADAGNPLGMYELAEVLSGGREPWAAADLAKEAFEKSAPLVAKNDADALFVSGALLAGGILSVRLKIDPPEGVRRLRRAAEQGHVEAASVLGRLLVRQDPRGAVRWLEQASRHRDPAACHALAELQGGGSNPRTWFIADPGAERVRALFQCAADQGVADAAYDLAVSYLGTDVGESRRWYRRAIELGHHRSIHYLAVLLFNGSGGPRDEAEGLPLLRRYIDARSSDAAELRDVARAIVRHPQSSREALEGAVAAVDSAMKRRDPDLWVDILALGYLRLGDGARAESLLRDVLARHGDPDTGYYVRFRIPLAEALAELGRIDEARAQLKRALAAMKGSDQVVVIQQLLAELDRR